MKNNQYLVLYCNIDLKNDKQLFREIKRQIKSKKIVLFISTQNELDTCFISKKKIKNNLDFNYVLKY